jgi:ribonuclease BN (tRNA processing enzyme)
VPIPAFAAAAAGADLLVHEATFGAGREDHAAAKRHATVAGALALAGRASAARTLLTHFSQRYPGLPPDAEEEADADAWEAAGAAGAVDGMVVPLRGEVWERLPAIGRAAIAALVGLRSGGEVGDDGDSAGWDSS